MTQIQLNDSLFLQPYEHNLAVHLPDDALLKIEEKELLLDMLYEIKKSGNLGKEEVYSQLSNYRDLSEDEFQDIFQILVDNNIVKFKPRTTHQLTDKELLKYDRQIKSFATLKGNNISDAIGFQEKIKGSRVCILGVGGVGSYVSYGLASMGIGELVLIDFDHIELSNTSRQMLYSEHDVGKQKLDVAKEKLSLVNPSLKIETFDRRITNASDLERYLNNIDILILAADTPRGKIVYMVDEACQNKKCPFIFGMPAANQIICGPLIIPGKTRSYLTIFPDLNGNEKIKLSDKESEKIDMINAGFVASIIDPYNAIAGKLVVLEVIKFLTGFSPCRLIDNVFNFNTNTMVSSITKV
jgi:molybdopterin/thiamine biosynthesis adenylyltransferase